ncbi:tetratricopeptide repeat protein [Myxococcus sp. Y35]|uniref:tetratricopeptide repeat protein n=1 Tax=Pseudomyxococcus flavus TaxID=3115648 RepID=UPI003CFB4B22
MLSLPNSRSFVRVFLSSLAVASLLGCAAISPSVVPQPEQTAGPTEPPPTASVGASSSEPEPANKLPPAIAAYEQGCQEGNAEDCYVLAAAYYEGKEVERDDAAVIALMRKACELGHLGGCFNTGVILFDGKFGHAVNKTAAIPFFEKACDGKRSGGCFNLGVAYLKGEGVAEDLQRGTAYMKQACALEHARACELVTALETTSESKGVPGANVTVDSVTVDGLTAKNLSCRLDGSRGVFGALAGPMFAMGALSKKKAELDKCAPKGAELRVTWSFSEGKVTNVSVEAPTPTIKSCMERVVSSTSPQGDGECATTLVLGKTP